MHPKDFRAQYSEEADRDEASQTLHADKRGTRELVAILRDRKAELNRRLASLRDATEVDPLAKPSVVTALLKVLGSPDEPARLRLAAMTVLAQASLRMVEFRRYQSDFTLALRTASVSEDTDLREGAMDLLALDHDPAIQEQLVEGLRNPQTATVAPEKALRMLGYDVHGDFYPLLHEIVATSKKPQLRRMSLRLLAADTTAKKTFAKIAADPSEDPVARSTSAIALQGMAPREFNDLARSIVADPEDSDDFRATLLTALTHDAEEPDLATTDLAERIERSARPSAQLKAAARQYLAQGRPSE